MLEIKEIDRIVDGAVEAILTRGCLSRAFSQPTTDFDGRDALQVTIVLNDNWRTEINGDRAVDTIVSVMQALQHSGESRFPIIEFATEDDLRSDDATQS